MSQIVLEPEVSQNESIDGRWMVVIFNNDYNSLDEVIEILIRATDCDEEEAQIETWEAHTFGKASVHFASRDVCEEAADIISSIGVRAEVTKEWAD